MHITEAHVEKAHAWFARVGHWGLTFGYFIPGVRHLTAYAAGMSALEPPQFALFAYPGGVLWVSAFLGLGYFLGDRWEAVEKNIEGYMKVVGIGLLILALAYLLWRYSRKRRSPAQSR
jgi:membrane protein DedA with SNARE-associated domain